MFFGGLIIGLVTFLTIGVFHPIVIKAEYYWGVKCWPAFALLGVAMLVLSVFLTELLWAAIAGVVGFSSLWSIFELFEQRKRVKKGWFPKNPKRKD